ncbi:MAG: T9SS type A sorting domain-containing protein [Candidatus Cloacimonetes bacterium]|nr:T9SS type A sorting domain-containing protein [Candidatus Cloacimonadota bacterium]
MKKKIIFCLLLCMLFLLGANTVNSVTTANIECVTNGNEIELQFTVPDYEIENLEAEGNIYQRIITTGAGEYVQPGYPDIPCFSTLVAVPDMGEVCMEINGVEQSIIENIAIYPRQSLQSESQSPMRAFVIDNDFYEGNTIFPETAAWSGEPAIMRDYRLVRVTFNPFQYDPASRNLIVNQQINVRVYTTQQQGINEITQVKKPSRAFDRLFRNTVVNYESAHRVEEFQQPCILYIYYNNNTVEGYLQYLVDWRREKGFEVHTASTSETGNSAANIQNYIEDAYEEWDNPPEYICLVGDGNGSYNIPCFWIDTGETDNNFVLLEGSDILPDASIGRLPFSTTTELATIVTKIINYEKDPYMGNTNWYNRALMVGDPTTSGTSCVDTKLIVDDMMSYTAPNIDPINVFSGNYSSQIASNINQGCVYFNYRGHGDFSGWSTYAIDGLSNGWMLPVVVFLTCGTGSYASYSDCMSERFLKVGSTSNPKGAVAAISTATSLTHTTYNNCIDLGIWTGLFVDENWNMGMGLSRGKLNMYLNFPTNPANCQHQFISWNNLMGDPAMDVWSDVPVQLSAVCPEQLNPGMAEVEVQVYAGGDAAADVWVTILDEDNNSVSARSEASGSAWLSLSGLVAGDLKVTATKHNHIPWQDELELSNNNDYIAAAITVIDDVTGNGDGYASPGEEIELELTLASFYSENLTNLTLTAESATPGVEFSIENLDIALIEANGVYVSEPNLCLTLPDNITGINDLIIDATLSSSTEIWSFRFTETVFAPCLLLDEYELSISGNFDPGEDTDLVVFLLNAGQQTASNVNLELVSSDTRLNVSESTAFCGQIPEGSSGNNSANPFHIIAQSEIIPGTQIELSVHITTPELVHPPISFLLTVGEAGVGDPLGPDAGGYYCYDMSDIGYIDCPEYNWIEIDPDHGGPGSTLNMYDNGNTGDTDQVDLPINFKFYGINYDELSICSNGWISPGDTDIRDFMNWSIPGPGGASPLIAPFWDDLMISSGNVCYYHDQENQTFIVEWSHLRIDYSNSLVTFQAILYDADYYPSVSGNSNLLFQYDTFHNDDLGSYGGFYVYHGQFATIGIEDHTTTRGLEYTYNNTYPLQADQLSDGSAIFFTSSPIPHEEAYLVLYEDSINDSGEDGQIDYGETAELLISLSNIGEQPASNVSAVAVLTDEYVTLTSATITYPDIAGGVYSYPETGFEIDVGNDCPNGHQINLAISINYNDITRELIRAFTVYAPDLESGYVFIMNDDNNNHIADPGETFDLGVSINNIGGSAVFYPDITIFSTDPDLQIEPAINQLYQINGSAESYLVFPAALAEGLEPGQYLEFMLNIAGDLDYTIDLQYNLSVSLCSEDFETGDYSRFPWETGGAADFVISTISHAGLYAAESGDIDDNQLTWLGIDISNPQPNQVSFWIKVSTESGWDFVRFFIDEALQDSWSGQTGWLNLEYDLAAGNHSLRWEYEKDTMVSGGSDCFWLDDISFPAAFGDTPEAILLDTAEFSFELSDLEFGSATLSLLNISTSLAQYEIRIEADEPSWLTVIPDEGFIVPGETAVVNINCEPQALATGEYYATICICDNFGNDMAIPVTLNYTNNSANEPELPAVTSFMGNYPNPFNPTTEFAFQLAESQYVNLDIYNIKGQKVRSLAAREYPAGYYQITWNGRDDQDRKLASGIYFSRFTCPQVSKYHKVLLLK